MGANTANIERMRELAEDVKKQHADLMPNVDAYEDVIATFWETYGRAFADRPENKGGSAKLIAEWERSNYERQLFDLASKLEYAMHASRGILYKDKSSNSDRLYDAYMPVVTTARKVRTWRVHLTRCNSRQVELRTALDTAIASRDVVAVYDVANDNAWTAFDTNAETGLKLIIGWADIADTMLKKLYSRAFEVEAEWGISLTTKLENQLGVSLESDDGVFKLLRDCVSLAESQLEELRETPNTTFCSLWRTRVLDAIKAFDGSVAPKLIRALEFVQSEHKAVPEEMLAELPTPEQFAEDINLA